MTLDRIAAAGPVKADQDPAKVKGAARQFEALLLTQLLRTARESSEGWLGTGEDQAGMSMLQIAEEHLAQMMADQGGIGLANLVVSGLEQRVTAAQPAATPEK